MRKGWSLRSRERTRRWRNERDCSYGAEGSVADIPGRAVKGELRVMLAVLKWIVAHVFVRIRNLNDDKDAKPVNGIEIGIGGEF